MNTHAVNDSSESISKHLISLLGGDVVLVWANKGQKGPRWRGWQHTGIEMMRKPAYLKKLDSGCNVAVLTGAPSGGLCSIDIDDDDSVEPFLALNPKLAASLRSRGSRGCNFWVRVAGAFPPPADIKKADGSAWGEWRSTGVCTMIHGVHPEGMNYERSPEVAPVTMAFADIQWPDNLKLPWLAAAEELPPTSDESDDPIVERYGKPVVLGQKKSGEIYVKDINQAYWAGLYDAENVVLFEPNEREFFLYDAGTGLYSVSSADTTKQVISSRMLGMSRQSDFLSPLESLRTDARLSAVVAHLRGIAEHRNAFNDRPRAVHLADCMLRLEGRDCICKAFSPEFRSRNRSPIPYDPDAKCPRFLNELVFPAVHPEDVVLLQKMAGQSLLGENLIQRFVILDGEAGRGKSQYANVVQRLVGMENVTQLRTDHLGERFELFRFLRRTLLVGVDVDANFLSSKGAPVIKGLVGGDFFDAEQKGGTGSFQIQGKFNILMTSNCRLKVKLQSDVGAWRRRMLIVRYESPPPKKKIPDFGMLLIREEGSGILNWALHGLGLLLKDIEETGDIRLTPRQQGVVDSLLAESDSLRFFLRDNVCCQSGSDLTVAEIVQAYAHYCPERGWDPMSDTQIGRQLSSLMLEMFKTVGSNSCQREGKAARGFRGVAFINPGGLL
jgi:putative DNA primase/helicase